jgi:hypothetical protein
VRLVPYARAHLCARKHPPFLCERERERKQEIESKGESKGERETEGEGGREGGRGGREGESTHPHLHQGTRAFVSVHWHTLTCLYMRAPVYIGACVCAAGYVYSCVCVSSHVQALPFGYLGPLLSHALIRSLATLHPHLLCLAPHPLPSSLPPLSIVCMCVRVCLCVCVFCVLERQRERQ